MTTKEYRELMQNILAWKAREAEQNGVYTCSKHVSEEDAALLNEGYAAGLREAERALSKSSFLTDKEEEEEQYGPKFVYQKKCC